MDNEKQSIEKTNPQQEDTSKTQRQQSANQSRTTDPPRKNNKPNENRMEPKTPNTTQPKRGSNSIPPSAQPQNNTNPKPEEDVSNTEDKEAQELAEPESDHDNPAPAVESRQEKLVSEPVPTILDEDAMDEDNPLQKLGKLRFFQRFLLTHFPRTNGH